MTKQQIPNLLTAFRVAAVPVVLVLAAMFPDQRQIIFWVFLAASVTDFFDGYLARKWNAVSPLGTLLDPIADKLLVAVVLLYLMEYTTAPIAAVGIILCREIYIAGLREFLALRSITLPVSKGGKWKTALQLAALTLLLLSIAYATPFLLINGTYLLNAWNLGVILLWVSAVLSLLSAADYTGKAIRTIR